ncbi:hypothetical protein JG687_00016698 [Phytophthora cactorum]|uniref:Uncharacterized protein n=1 Tax=Phytophthora cactorum TaxID=29920 RepID=A0A8T1TRM1_9STRA|nr:hypothetical protein JG687_00016698 [Phytophthora cactorum]
MPRGLKTPFQDGHGIKYALEISKRHPETCAVLASASIFGHVHPVQICLKAKREPQT